MIQVILQGHLETVKEHDWLPPSTLEKTPRALKMGPARWKLHWRCSPAYDARSWRLPEYHRS